MKEIRVLPQETIDQIAAGEVVERPASVVKELVENAIDAGASAVTCEIREGGAVLIRITDNGEGIEKAQIATAFLPHATSKIRSADELLGVPTLGFRGEALSSISAVAKVELITKTPGALVGCRYRIEGGQEIGLEEIGAPEGSTFIVRDLFYNVPARKKFLRSSASEAGAVSDLIEHMALSHPGVSFKFIVNGQVRMHTSGNHALKDIIYSLYGRDTAANLLEIGAEAPGIKITGYIGKPVISRGNRGAENYFVNGRFIRSNVIAKAIEEGYRTFMMQHRYPFTVLFITLDGEMVDVNVHPAKMEVRFSDAQAVYDLLSGAVRAALTGKVLLPKDAPAPEKSAEEVPVKKSYPEPFESMRRSWTAEKRSPYERMYPERTGRGGGSAYSGTGTKPYSGTGAKPASGGTAGQEIPAKPAEPAGQIFSGQGTTGQEVPVRPTSPVSTPASDTTDTKPSPAQTETTTPAQAQAETSAPAPAQAEPSGPAARSGEKPRQMELFREQDTLLTPKGVASHRLIGQLFETYWLIEYEGCLYIIDQHAAHEKVMYERLLASLENKTFTSQMVSPPIILTLRMQEAALLEKYMEEFQRIGFEISQFGGHDYAISAVPGNFFDFTDAELFTAMLDSLGEASGPPAADLLLPHLATMACKSAVKGNTRMSAKEADALIAELLTLKDPYNCPHGRPTIIRMTKQELEKKFHRIV